MSGSTIGGVIGGVIGAWFGGNWQLGYAIGSAIGGAIDPTVIKGPSIGDAQQQSSQAGRPIPAVFGHSPPIAGTIVDGDPKARKIKRRKAVGKGSGQVQESEGFIATRLFLVAESPGGNANIARIRRNGKLVYSAIAGDPLDAESAGFAGQLTIMRGADDQMPHPALEALHGVGNTPYYRGRLCVLIENDDETDTRGAANQYLFEVVSCGDVTPGVDTSPHRVFVLGTGGAVRGTNDETVWSAAASVPASVPAILAGGGGRLLQVYSGGGRLSLDRGQTWSAVTGIQAAVPASVLYEPGADRFTVYYHSGAVASTSVGGSTAFSDVTIPSRTYYNVATSGGTVVVGSSNATVVRAPTTTGPYTEIAIPAGDATVGVEYVRSVGGKFAAFTTASLPVCTSGDDGIAGSWAQRAHPLQSSGGSWAGVADGDGIIVALSDAGRSMYSPDGGDSWVLGGTIASFSGGGAGATNNLAYDALNRVFVAIGAGGGAVYTLSVDAPGGAWTARGSCGTTTVDNVVYLDPQLIQLPDAPGWFLDRDGNPVGPGRATIDACTIEWRDVVGEIGRRCGIPADRMDIGGMTDVVPGYVLARLDLSGSDYVRELCTFGFADLPEYDDQLHAVRRGGDVVATIDEDLCEVEEEDDNNRPLSLQYPQRVTVYYPDPANNYVVTPQVAERTSPDVEASTELNMQCTIPYDGTTVAQKADILQKIAFNQAEGSFKRALPPEYSRLVASDAVMFRDRRYLLTKVSYEEMRVLVEGEYDRVTAYTSLAVGADAPAPQPGSSNLKGPTLLQVIQGTQPFRDADAQAGFYVAAYGKLDTWPGCDLYMSVDEGETEQLVATILDPATVGVLTSPLAAGGSPLQVVLSSDDVLESVSSAQIAARQNAAAILTGGAPEVLQFQDAADTGTRTWDLTTLTRGRLGTNDAPHVAGDAFVLLDGAVTFIPLSYAYAGATIILHAVTRGTAPANNLKTSFVYAPWLGGEVIVDGNDPPPSSGSPPPPTPGGAGIPGTPTARTIGTTVVTPTLATGSGAATSNTAAINAAFASLPVGGGNPGGIVRIPAGDWWVDPSAKIFPLSNCAFDNKTNGATLRCINGGLSQGSSYTLHKDLIQVANSVHDVEIYGGHLVGFRVAWAAAGGTSFYTPGTSEWNHGIYIGDGAHNVTVYDLTASEFGGDGISIGKTAYNIHVLNVRSTNNRRQGISVAGISSGANIKIENCECDHIGGSDGTSPMAGIDCEVDTPSVNSTSGIEITNCYLHHNTGPGLICYKSVNNITITDLRSEYNSKGIYAFDSDNVSISGTTRIRWNHNQGLHLKGTCSSWSVRADFYNNNTKSLGNPSGGTTTTPTATEKAQHITVDATVTGLTFDPSTTWGAI